MKGVAFISGFDSLGHRSFRVSERIEAQHVSFERVTHRRACESDIFVIGNLSHVFQAFRRSVLMVVKSAGRTRSATST
jgi:hypothetical protein